MKALLVTALLALTSAGVAFGDQQVVDLNQERVLLGSLNPEQNGPANVQFTLRRTAMTPEKVELVYSVNYLTTICAQYDARQVWVPGTWVCHDVGGDYHDGGYHDGHPGHGPRPGPGPRRDCYQTPGYYRTERYCVQYADVMTSDSHDIELKFKDANNLGGGEEETFAMSIVQRSQRSNNVDFSASALQTKTPYEIKSTLLGGGLKFKAK